MEIRDRRRRQVRGTGDGKASKLERTRHPNLYGGQNNGCNDEIERLLGQAGLRKRASKAYLG